MSPRFRPPLSRFATSESRFPRRFPGPGWALTVRQIGLVCTTRPRTSRLIAPTCRSRIGVARAAAVGGGAACARRGGGRRGGTERDWGRERLVADQTLGDQLPPLGGHAGDADGEE